MQEMKKSELIETIRELESKVDDLESTIKDLEFELQDAKAHMTNMEDQINDLESDINDEIDDLDGLVKDLNFKVEELENKQRLEPAWRVDQTNDKTAVLYAGDWECPQWAMKKIAENRDNQKESPRRQWVKVRGLSRDEIEKYCQPGTFVYLDNESEQDFVVAINMDEVPTKE